MSYSNEHFSFKTLETASMGIYREKGSKFLAYAYPLDSLTEIEQNLSAMRKAHPKARHLCYAYRIGISGEQFRANDDGEPSGTGGKPILGRIDAGGLTNLLIGVIRYFGGVKLGAAGLGRAYRNAAADALQNAHIIIKTVQVRYQLELPYASVSGFQQTIHQMGAEILQEQFDAQKANYVIQLPLSLKAEFEHNMHSLAGIQFELIK